MQRVREWSSLKPALHSHMVPKYERTQRPFAQLHSSESSSELSPAGKKGVGNRVGGWSKTPKRVLCVFSISILRGIFTSSKGPKPGFAPEPSAQLAKVPVYLGCSWRKLPGNPAPRQTRSPGASGTGGWTYLKTRVPLGPAEGDAERSEDVFSLLTRVSGRTGVALGPPAAAVVAAALRVGHHHVVLGLAADQTLVHMEETHVLVSRGAIWENKGQDESHFDPFKNRGEANQRVSTLEHSSSSGWRPAQLHSVKLCHAFLEEVKRKTNETD